MSTPIDTEEQINRPLAAHGAEGAIQALVAMFSTTPDGVLDGAVDVVLRIALDDEHPPTLKIPVELFRVIAVGSFQFLQDRVGFYTWGRSRLSTSNRVTVTVGPSTLPKCCISVSRSHPAGLKWLLRALILWLDQRWGLNRERLSYLLWLWSSLGDGVCWGAEAFGAGPLLSQVPMSMLCFIGGGGSVPPTIGPLFVFILGCGFAGLLAMAAHEVGFETGMFTFVPPLPERTPVSATLLTTEPTVLTAEVVTSPIFRPTMPCSRLFIPGALLRVSL